MASLTKEAADVPDSRVQGEPMTATAALHLGVVLYENRREQVERLTRSLTECRHNRRTPPFAVSWLDHSGTDALEPVLAAVGEANYRWSNRNPGFGAGHNVLMRDAFAQAAVSAYVCVNPDAVLHPECLAELAAESRRQERPGLIEARQFPDEHPKIYDPVSHRTPWCAGCVLWVTRPLFDAVGGFDEQLFLYCEDVDYSWRARAAGFGTFIVPRALVHHYADDRTQDPRRHMLASGAYLAKKYADAAFERTCKNEYRALAGTELDVPAPAEVSAGARAVADFTHGFSFAEARW
jgi:N-acetylglucosaminyl-diphospho-decaprenol L-rhamnosyltransferase